MNLACHIRPWGEDFQVAWEEARQAGFTAVESYCLSQWFPKPEAFREMLGEAGVTLAAMEYGGEWVNPERAAGERDGAERLARFLADIGAPVMVVSGGRRPPKGASLDRYDALSNVMNELGGFCRDLGVRLCFHPREGTLIEYRDQIGLLMEATDPEQVSLCLDTGELARTGSDPIEVLQAYGPRVGHIHLKDLDWSTSAPVVPGKGALNLVGVLEELQNRQYGGWVTVELDRSLHPLEDARAARECLAQQGLAK
ncbi:MAG: sugar phosphate isomerase/epimerase [Armatimonadetes bacterium]|nr:sugar phosphate isomerase/epimerase [Armatimonadota bacterium]